MNNEPLRNQIESIVAQAITNYNAKPSDRWPAGSFVRCSKEAADQILALVEDRLDDNEEKMQAIKRWCEAYPLDIFPEPDFKKAAKALNEHGITLDAISASSMRHVLKGIQKIIDE